MDDWSLHNEREADFFERDDRLVLICSPILRQHVLTIFFYVKSISDLDKLKVNEELTDIDRTEQLLRNGFLRQKISVLQALPSTLAGCHTKYSLSVALDSIQVAWKNRQLEDSSAICFEILKTLGELANTTVDGKVISLPAATYYEEYNERLLRSNQKKKETLMLLSNEQILNQLLPLVLDFVEETHEKEHAEVASNALISSIARIGSATKNAKILRVAVGKGDVTETAGSRLLCCLLLGAVIAMRLIPIRDIEDVFLEKMVSLCQDTDADIRKCMCIQVDSLARAISHDTADSVILDELLELLNDEEEQVKKAAFSAFLSLLDYYSSQTRRDRIIPEITHFVVDQPIFIIPLLAEKYGILMTKLSSLGELSIDNTENGSHIADTTSMLLEGFTHLIKHEDPTIRRYCAYNFPAVVKAFRLSYLCILLENIMPALATDSDAKVRMHLAAGIHEVALIAGFNHSFRYVKPLMLQLLTDDSSQVLGKVISKTSHLLSYFTKNGLSDDHKVDLVDAALRSALLYLMSLTEGQNRERAAFVKDLGAICAWFSSTQLYDTVIPVLFEFLEKGTRPVQLEAIRVIVCNLRRLELSSHRIAIMNRLRNDFGIAGSYWRRILYLESCMIAGEVNSLQYYRYNYLNTAIDLLDDPIPNVRMKAISHLPRWHEVFSYLREEHLLEKIQNYLSKSEGDADRDVRDIAQAAKKAIEKSSMTKSSSLKHELQVDLEDKRKLDEEELSGMITDHEEPFEVKWSSMIDYSVMVAKDGQLIRRARVKTLEMVSKIPGKAQHKEQMKNIGCVASNTLVPGNPGLLLSSVSGTTGNATGGPFVLASAVGSTGSRQDSFRGKLPPKSGLVKGPSSNFSTTLPNCSNARSALLTKKNPPIRFATNVVSKTGNLFGSSTKVTKGTPINTINIKDSTILAKIPVIRPIITAGKRESSPSTGTRLTIATSNSNTFDSQAATNTGSTSVGGTIGKTRLTATEMGGNSLKPRSMIQAIARQ
uniref:Uncharacterized protein AlNc14C107G6246 n=1 Tax=Albugo laibachii Nc14 TaxID=890382 RepID=F0WI39_9STRA|nr:conserved hypothetical protein [Albugo laibachii Nc14]|eukprot:CCA20917.1 conserved hypothetical protein [Albugo laibachii Nc14]